jgi:voltage-gated potassium channel Kch
LFFLSVGMLIDFEAVAAKPMLVAGIAIGIIVVKAVVIAGLALLFGMRPGRAIWLGLLLSQAGEFGFVLFGQAASAQLVTPEAASLFSAVVTLTMVSTPFLMQVIEWVLRRIPEPANDLEGPEFSPETNVIVVGYGRFGQTVAQMLMAKKIPVTIIDSKASQIELSEEFGTKVYYGDGTRIDLLRTAGAESAEGILFCQNPKELTLEKLEAVFETFPHAAIMARVYDRLQVMEFDGLDLAVCQRELYESAVVMGREALIKLGTARREAERVEREYRERDLERLQAQTTTGDLHAGFDRSFAVDRPLPDEAIDPA